MDTVLIDIEWQDTIGPIVNGPLSCVCEECGAMLIGEGSPIPIICLDCFRKLDGSIKNDIINNDENS